MNILFKKNSTIFCWLSVTKLDLQLKPNKKVEVEIEEIGFFPYPSEDDLDGAVNPLLNLI